MSIVLKKHCANCGDVFRRPTLYSYAVWEKQRYCSRVCSGIVKTATAVSNRPPMEEVFSKWFKISTGCWEWQGALDKDGYGVFTYAGKTLKAHRAALILGNVELKPGYYACHHCDNPRCVRLSHLYAGTPKQNVSDAIKRGRMKLMKAAKLTEKQVIAIRLAKGTHDEIAKKFLVSRPAVTLIKNRNTWKHVP